MSQDISAWDRAAQHPIALDKPAVNFFEGAVLGNGGMGVIVCTRADAVMLHFGHNDIWDFRIAEAHKDQIGTFQEIFDKIKAIPTTLKRLEDDPWYSAYVKMAQENYRKPYPRPFPCGTLVLGFDRREAELLGHGLDISNGVCTVRFLIGKDEAALEIFCDPAHDRVWLRMRGPASFDRVHLLPDRATPREFPPASPPDGLRPNQLAFLQILPSQEDCTPHAARSCVPAWRRGDGAAWRSGQGGNGMRRSSTRTRSRAGGRCPTAANSSPASRWIKARPRRCRSPTTACGMRRRATRDVAWGGYWSRSAVALDDVDLERIWYRNLYFLNCAARPGATCPGLFANWSYRQHRHGVARRLPHELQHAAAVLGHVLAATTWRSTCPTSIWSTSCCRSAASGRASTTACAAPISRTAPIPCEMTMMPYPVPTWGWEICETPWTVQSLWWHYLYTHGRRTFLRAARLRCRSRRRC